jgi:hypothetical protein
MTIAAARYRCFVRQNNRAPNRSERIQRLGQL